MTYNFLSLSLALSRSLSLSLSPKPWEKVAPKLIRTFDILNAYVFTFSNQRLLLSTSEGYMQVSALKSAEILR